MPSADLPLPGAREIFSRRMASRLEERDGVLRELLQAVSACGFRPDAYFHRLCLDEALTNAVVHGNRGDPLKAVRVRAFCSPRGWGVEIADEGEGFDWADWVRRLREGQEPEGDSGRGVALILRSGADVEFLDGGSRIRMSWSAGSAPPRGGPGGGPDQEP